jgi:hypothetical protein
VIRGDLYGLTIKAADSSETSVCTESYARSMNVHVDLSKVLESTLIATIRDGLYLNWERRNLCCKGESKIMALHFV